MKTPVILYVDDERSALEVLKLGLEEKGYDVQTFLNGDDALKFLKTTTPDLIIADLRMQPMNGFDFFQAVKKIKNAVAAPFLFLTAVDDYLAQKYSQTLGVDGYVVKPLDLENFEGIIRRKLQKK
jgi:DNA-binding response OmpR family regulator